MAASRYRRFLKLCEEWPVDETKRGRDLGAYLRQRVAQAFREGENTQVTRLWGPPSAGGGGARGGKNEVGVGSTSWPAAMAAHARAFPPWRRVRADPTISGNLGERRLTSQCSPLATPGNYRRSFLKIHQCPQHSAILNQHLWDKTLSRWFKVQPG